MAFILTKTLISKLLQRQTRRTSKAFTVPALSAGAKGYWTIGPLDIQAGAHIVSMFAWTSNIAAAGGLQLTPCFVGGGSPPNLYVWYYAPTAISANAVNLTFYITYHV